MNQFATLIGHEKAIIILLIGRNLTQWNNPRCWIEDKQMAQLGMLIERRHGCFETAFRQLDSQDHMVKAIGWRSLLGVNAAIGGYGEVIGLYADLPQHGAQYRGLVLAITVSIAKSQTRRMRLVPANSNFNRGVPDITLGKI